MRAATRLCFVLLLITSIALCQKNIRSEQTHFSADTKVRHPATLPQRVLDLLAADELVRDELEDEQLSANKLPKAWFSASEIHLSKSKVADLLVISEPPLAGSNVTTFWIFRKNAKGYDLLLKAPAHDLRLLNSRTHGYRDIELASATATVISTTELEFNGKQYVIRTTHSEAIN